MVKSELGNGIKSEPCGSCCVITAFYILYSHKSIKGYSYNSFSRIPIRGAQSMKLFNVCTCQPSFFFELTECSFFTRFIHLYKASGESPMPFVRFNTSFYKQNLKFRTIKSKYHTVCCDRWMRVFITIHFIFHFVLW